MARQERKLSSFWQLRVQGFQVFERLTLNVRYKGTVPGARPGTRSETAYTNENWRCVGSKLEEILPFSSRWEKAQGVDI